MLEIIAYVYFTMGIFTAILLMVKFLSIVLKKHEDYGAMSRSSHVRTHMPSFHVVIPAWNERDVISNTIEKIEAARAKFNVPLNIWVATYPNDYSTLRALRGILKNENNVSVVINPQSGPTTKSQNLTQALLTVVESVQQDCLSLRMSRRRVL